MKTRAEQLKDLQEGKQILVCGRHQYSPGGPKMPTQNCSDCWFAFYFHHFARLPKGLRQEALEEAEMVIRHAAEAESQGKLDWEPHSHPKIESIISEN